ncbi:MAG: DUF2914 domain-containing protein [Candidatus Margulisbacteria bacterium]|jgi:hypothetical protein|nr:DUF2914 domain-containing protein [Candidatus Margulisiibacteriota bacterium]
MSKITGYARQDEPKWFYLGLLTMALIICAGLYLGGKLVYCWVESGTAARLQAAEQKPSELKVAAPAPALKAAIGPAGELGGVRVERMTFTSGLGEANQPLDDLSEILAGKLETLYCATRLTSDRAQTVRHVWLRPDGSEAAQIELHLGPQTVNTYSYKNIYGGQRGAWEVQVRNEKDEVIARKSFTLN